MYCIYTLFLKFTGKLTHDEKSSQDEDAGFATVEESSIGKKEVNRGMSNPNSNNL